MMRLDRRQLIVGAAAMAAASPAWAVPARPAGVQLWSVNDLMAADVPGTLRAIGRIGYRSVETAGLHGLSPDAFLRALRAADPRCDAAHVELAERPAEVDDRIAQVRDLGARWLVVPSPRPPRALDPAKDWATALGEAMTPDAWRRNAEHLQTLAERAARAGLRVAYHNHAAEFAGAPGERGFDLLLAGTDPAALFLELDVAWAVVGGLDPADLLREHRARIRLLHLKDLASTRPVRTVAVGQGIIDWPALLAAASQVEHAFVEVEAPYPQPPLEMLARSLAFLRERS